MPALIIRLKARELRRVIITRSTLVIGRASDSDVVIDYAGISNVHAVLKVRDGEYVLTDKSKNGTFLNGERMEGPAILADGDEVQIGRYTLVFAALIGMAATESPVRRRRRRPLQQTVEMTPEEVEAEVEAGAFGFEDAEAPEEPPAAPPPRPRSGEWSFAARLSLIVSLAVALLAGWYLLAR